MSQAAPGGVGNNLRIWLDADQGVTGTSAITQWDDVSGNTKHVTQNTTLNQPSLNTASSVMNFHRSIELDGDQDFLEASGVMPNQTDDITFFIVTEADQSSGAFNQFLGMGTFLAYPHIGFYPSGQVFYSSGVAFPDYRDFSINEPMRYNEPLIYSGAIDFSIVSSPAYNYLNGFQNSDIPTVFSESLHGGDTRFTVGGDDTDEDFDGRIAEVALYNTILSTTERHQVESYLAIKYGQTLTNNYLNSSATAVYTLDGTYNFGVFGLAKDLTGDLDQRISRGVNDSAGLVISTDTDFISANSSHSDTLSDGDYLLLGHDNGSTISTQTTDLSTIFDKRTVREWKVENTSSVGAINMQFSTLPALATGQSYVLLSDSDGNFSSGSAAIKYTNTTTFSDITFPAGTSYFTIAIITNKIEFTLASNNDNEDNGANLPAIAVFGYIPTTTAVTLNLSGTANNGTDYSNPSLSIPAGTYNGQPASNLSLINFSILDDTSAENDETSIITLDIGAITDFVIGDANDDTTTQNAFTYTIIDEDISVSVSGSLLTATVNSATANGIDTGNITLQLNEEDGDDIALSNVDLTFTISSGIASFSNNQTTFTTTTNASGLASATIKSTLTGIVNITATLDRDEDGGTTPEESVTNGSPTSVTFLPGPASSTITTISVSPASVTTDGGATSTLTIQAKDAQGNNLTSSGGIVTLAENSATAILSAVINHNDGSYTATISNTVAETVTISGTIAGNNISSGNQTINFTPGSVSAINTTISASPTSVTTNVGATSTITIQAKDAQGNNLTASGGTVTLAEDSATAVLSAVTDNNDGTYTATINNNVAESVIISGTIAGNTISSGNQTINFTPSGVSGANTTISASLASVTTDGGATSTLTIQAKDDQGNIITRSAGTLTLAKNSATAVLGTINDHNDGTYTATISNTVAESVTISGNISATAITDTVELTFTPGLASAATTSFSTSPDILRGNGTDTSVITIQAIDTNGNHLLSGGDTLILSVNNSASISRVTDHNNGNYTASATNSNVETTTITGTINGQEISSQTSISFIAYGVVQINESDGQFVNGIAPPGTTITVFDSQGLALCTTTADSLTGSYHCAITTVQADEEILTVTATDLAGNNESSTTTILFEDSDNDGISDLIEADLKENGGAQETAINTDTDGDHLPDYAEFILGSNYLSLNSPVADGHLDDDNDGVSNAIEYFLADLGGAFDSELSTDTDLDGLPDVTELITELANVFNANHPTNDGLSDDNSNGLSNAVEAYLQALSITDISLSSDYDGDGYADTLEVRLASNPLLANEPDTDDDGVNNAIEAFLTGTTNDGGDTVINDRDNDDLPDIFELSVITDRFDPASDINLAENGDVDHDGITDAVELYLYGNTNEATTSTDRDLDGTTDIIEISLGSDAFRASKPSLWIDVEYLDSGTVKIQGNIAGVQAPPPILTWDLSGLLTNQSNLTDAYPTARTVLISGLEPGIHTIQLSVSRHLNDKELTSLIDYSFNIKASQNADTDKDGVSNAYDMFNAHTGKEEYLHSALGDATRYFLQTQNGQFARLGKIASLSNNQVANITSRQIEETVESGQPITLGTPSTPPSIDDTHNIFDFEILNLPETASASRIVIPLHHPLPIDPVLLKFEPSSSLWSFFLTNNKDNYSSAQGLAGICPAPGDNQYTQGLSTGHHCLQLQITDGSDNDADHLPNGAIRHLTGIGSGSMLPIGVIPSGQSDDSAIEEQDTQSEPAETATSNVSLPIKNEAQKTIGGGGSIDHLTLVLLSLFALSVFSSAKAGPTGGNITHGNGEISTVLEQTTITQNSNRLAIDWQSFNVTSTEKVNFVQPNGSSIVLNRDFSGLPSQIFGKINANGQVLLLNSAGILIGENASIDVGGFLASDMETTIEDFSQGNFTLTDHNQTQGGITNLGDIQTKGSSGIYIAGQFIDNSGSLLSSSGDIHLSTASEVIISTSDDGLLGVQLTQPLETEISPSGNLIYNSGDIVSFNGNIFLDLFYSDAIKANTVNNQGLVNAVAITEGNGKVFLTLTTSPELSERITEVDSIVADSQTDSTAPNSNTTIEIELTPPTKVSIDTIMPDCNADTGSNETDCSKYQAIKNYLSRLLLGGELPE